MRRAHSQVLEKCTELVSRRSLVICTLLTLSLSGCGYLKNRVTDACDIVYFSGGWGPGGSAEIFLGPWSCGAGYHHTTVAGWEGRSWFYREEQVLGFVVVGGELQRDLRDVSWPERMTGDWIVPAEFSEKNLPYINRRFFAAGIAVGDVFPRPGPVNGEFDPHVFLAGKYPVNWGVGAGIGVGMLSARFGVHPTRILDFAFGLAGFHVFPPYKLFTNTLDDSYLQDRGIPPSPVADDLGAFCMDRLRTSDAYEIEKIYCVKELGLMGSDAVRFLPELKAILQRPHVTNQVERLRIHVAVVVHRLDPKDVGSIEFLEALLDDPDEAAFARAALAALHESRDSDNSCPGSR